MKEIPPGEDNGNFVEDFAIMFFGWEGELEYNSAMQIQQANHSLHFTQRDLQVSQYFNILFVLDNFLSLPKDICGVIASYYSD